MRIAIDQPHYMPSCDYLRKMASADLFVFLNNVQFEKNDFQNRNRVRNSESWQWITVPVAHHFPSKICDTEVDFTHSWQKDHMHALDACYGTAPFYKQYSPLFAEFFCAPASKIDRIAIDSVRLLAGILGISTESVFSSDYKFKDDKTARLINVCRHFKATTYVAYAAEKEHTNASLMKEAGIDVEFLDAAPIVYPQHWSKSASEFIPGLSAIDIIFNCGERSLNVLRGIGAGMSSTGPVLQP
jgi:hypothetical protein